MAWILLLLAIACFVFTFFTTSIGLGVCCVLLSLVLVSMSALMLLSARVGNAARDTIPMSPEEWRAMRGPIDVPRAPSNTASGVAEAVPPASEDAPRSPPAV
ncbi:MAG TPA: hypothetical protein VK753_09075 [Xanthomonadaceae bacterium]|jgi:hypothetical protein|nr:hypothetical protein [Xanthomonadaceae bacterium]